MFVFINFDFIQEDVKLEESEECVTILRWFLLNSAVNMHGY